MNVGKQHTFMLSVQTKLKKTKQKKTIDVRISYKKYTFGGAHVMC